MAGAAVNMASFAGHSEMPQGFHEPRWYAAYTRAHHEKRVAQQLAERAVEHYLPVYEAVHRWRDRRILVQSPLFPGYVFIRIPLRNQLEVLRIPSVVRIVGFNGAPTPLPEKDIERLRRAMAEGVRTEPHPYLKVGRRVRITAGPFAGCEGILKRCRGGLRLVLAIELIHRAVLVDVDVSTVVPIGRLSDCSVS